MADGKPIPAEEMPTARALRGVTTQNVMMAVHQSGRAIWVSASAAPICTQDGQLLGAVASFVDITEMHNLQEQQKVFLHLVSHDMRAPLTIMNGYVGMLAESLAENITPTTQMCIEAIERAIKRMDVMIDDLAIAARLESGQVIINTTSCDILVWLPEFLQRSSSVLDHSLFRGAGRPGIKSYICYTSLQPGRNTLSGPSFQVHGLAYVSDRVSAPFSTNNTGIYRDLPYHAQYCCPLAQRDYRRKCCQCSLVTCLKRLQLVHCPLYALLSTLWLIRWYHLAHVLV